MSFLFSILPTNILYRALGPNYVGVETITVLHSITFQNFNVNFKNIKDWNFNVI